MRTGTQGYGVFDTNRRKYGQTERDDATGLDHTWWRKYESRSGRWTSPDPYPGSMMVADPQSLNRYSYVVNDPVNLVDPTGLIYDGPRMCFVLVTGYHTYRGDQYVSTTITGVEKFCLGAGGFFANEREPRAPSDGTTKLVNATLSREACQKFMNTVLNNASTKSNKVLEGGDIQRIFADFLAQKKGGVSRGRVSGAKYGTASGKIGTKGKGNGVINIPLYPNSGVSQDWWDASGIVNELPHIAGSQGGWPNREEYDDYALAQATYKGGYDSYSSFKGKSNPFVASPTSRYDPRWSNYFHDILRKLCPVPNK